MASVSVARSAVALYYGVVLAESLHILSLASGKKSKCCHCSTGEMLWSASGTCNPCNGSTKMVTSPAAGCGADFIRGNGRSCADKCVDVIMQAYAEKPPEDELAKIMAVLENSLTADDEEEPPNEMFDMQESDDHTVISDLQLDEEDDEEAAA